jgi:hypothetical protein
MKSIYSLLILLLIFTAVACKEKKSEEEMPDVSTTGGPDINNTLGYGVLAKAKGIWNGPVTSTTPLGGYPEWIVDFRPVTENQVAAKNELDTLNDIFMSFFIAKYNNEYKMAFRNGGSFGGMKRVSYFLADSVSETAVKSYYRFSEILKGKSRAFTEVIFNNDSMTVKSYTNKYNTLTAAAPHMTWRATLQDSTSTTAAVSHFGFPKKTLTKDFSATFIGQTEAVYYSGANIAADPYPETAQPYLGQTTINYTYDASHVPNPAQKVMLIVMTQPLFSGMTPLLTNLKYRSRYVTLAANDQSFTFNYMHPGSYYVYAVYDTDGNGTANSGDWISTANTSFTLNPLATANASPQINFTIP